MPEEDIVIDQTKEEQKNRKRQLVSDCITITKRIVIKARTGPIEGDLAARFFGALLGLADDSQFLLGVGEGRQPSSVMWTKLFASKMLAARRTVISGSIEKHMPGLVACRFLP
ncbi:hypothetical protein ACW180_00105 [Limosilactobacillus fermentum]